MKRDEFIQTVLKEGERVLSESTRRKVGEYTIEITSRKAIVVTLNRRIVHYSTNQGVMVVGDKTLPQIAQDLPIFFNP